MSKGVYIMFKSTKELATEITITYIKACGEAVTAGKLKDSCLQPSSIKDMFAGVYNQINKCESK